LRHTSATLLLEAGASPASVQRQLRHSTLAMTERYLHASADYVRADVEKLVIPAPARPSQGAGHR